MMTKYNELVDYQVSKMKTNERKSFDELYEQYSSMSIPEQITNLKQLGRDLFNKLDKIIDQLDTVLEEDKKD